MGDVEWLGIEALADLHMAYQGKGSSSRHVRQAPSIPSGRRGCLDRIAARRPDAGCRMTPRERPEAAIPGARVEGAAGDELATLLSVIKASVNAGSFDEQLSDLLDGGDS